MFISLTFKESKQWLKSTLYWVYVVIILLFYLTQMGGGKGITKPLPDQESYGSITTTDPNIIMNGALNYLVGEYSRNSFRTYPVGFYKEVILSEGEQNELGSVIEAITGVTINTIEEQLNTGKSVEVREGITYEVFTAHMQEVEEIVGGGTLYGEGYINRFGDVPKTYEQALEHYEEILEKDKISGAYARLFCDYMGIVLGILPIFFGVARVLQDKRNDANQVIYSKKVSSFKIVLSRYIATIIMLFIPVLLISCLSLSQSIYIGKTLGVPVDYLAYVRYSVGWLLPIILVVTALGFCITELTGGVIAILLQGIWWFGSIYANGGSLVGAVGYNLVPRYNRVGDYGIYEAIFDQLVINRLMYTGVAVVFVILTILIYNVKRKGGAWGVRKIPNHTEG